MITINLYLIPLIIIIVLAILGGLIENNEVGPIKMLLGAFLVLSLIFYSASGIIWLITHVRITY
jgi:hypothetical protein